MVGKTDNGKSKRKYVYAKDTKTLDKKLLELRVLYNQGTVLNNESISVKQLGEIWFDQTQKNNELSTQKRNKGILNNYIYPELGNIYLKNLKTYHIQTMVTEMLKDKKDTVRKTLQIIKSMLEIAVNNDFVAKNVAKPVKIPTFKTKEKRPLSSEEQKIIEESTHKYRDFFVFLLYTGLRKGEVSALTWNDIDFKNGIIKVNKSLSFVSNKGTLKSTKNGKERIIPMLDKTREILERQKNISKSIYIFHKQDNTMLSDIAIKRMKESFLLSCNKCIAKKNKEIKKEEDKIPELYFTLHQLRHTFCTMLYYSGISSKKAQQIMGHSSLKVTLEIYTHLDEEQENNSTALLNSYINNR